MTTLALALAWGGAFLVFLAWSESAIVARSVERREAVATRVEARTDAELHVAVATVEDLERAARLGALRVEDADAVEARFFAELLDHPTLDDVTLTHAGGAGLVWQISVFRSSDDPASAIWTRRIRGEGPSRVSELRRRPRDGALLAVPFEREPGTPPDPTAHDTYQVTVAPGNYGRLLWSDLAFSELDRARPQAEQRVVLTLQKTVEDAPGHLSGVLRAGLLARTIDSLPRLGAEDVDPGGPERVFLCDERGRLLTRLAPGDPLESSGDDLRVRPSRLPPRSRRRWRIPRRTGRSTRGVRAGW